MFHPDPPRFMHRDHRRGRRSDERRSLFPQRQLQPRCAL